MTQQFQLEPPPDGLRTPLVQLKDHYVQQVIEYSQKLALAKEKLAHVEALLEGWSRVEELPLTTELPYQNPPNPPTPTPAAFSAAIPENVSSQASDVASSDSSLTSSNGNASGAVNKSAVLTHQGNGTSSHTSVEEPFFPKLLERFKDTLDTSTRTLLSFCVDSGGIELTDASIGGKTLSLECPNDAVFRRLKLKLPGLASKWNQSVGSQGIVVVSTAKNPLYSKVLSSWSKEDLAQLSLLVDKMFELLGVTYTQLTHTERSWLVIVPNSVLSPLEVRKNSFWSHLNHQPPPTRKSMAAATVVLPRTGCKVSKCSPLSRHESNRCALTPVSRTLWHGATS